MTIQTLHAAPRAANRTMPGPDPALAPLTERIDRGERLTRDDGLLLQATDDLWTVCTLADLVRRRLHGDVAFYNINRHINYSNVCALRCTFCSFYRKKGQDGAYEYSIDQIRQEAIDAAARGATELHIVGGLHPWLPFTYYTDMVRAIRDAAPRVHVKAFTAVEIVHLARLSGRGRAGDEGIRAVLEDLIDAGLGSLPGGGAEVFDDRVHDEAFKGKIRAGQWLDVHRIAHELGLCSNATMLYGHVERPADRIDHMLQLRAEQDRALASWAREQGWPPGHGDAVVLHRPGEPGEPARLPEPPRRDTRDRSGFFQTVIPLPFFPDDSALEHLPAPTGLENLRTLAIARLMLDNIPHVKAFWIMQSLPLAQMMLQCGADDIDGTVVWYDITKLGGTTTHQETSAWDLQRAIREAGFRPIERDTLYRPIERDGDDPAAWRLVEPSTSR